MVHAVMAPRLGREFDPFLFASIGEDRPGQLLSVISALARSGLDPWEEAVGLARMSRALAAARLSRLIAALPGEPKSNRPVDAIAGELIALLPRPTEFVATPLPSWAPAAVAPAKVRFGIALCALILMVAVSLALSVHPSAGPDRATPLPRADESVAASPATSAPVHRP